MILKDSAFILQRLPGIVSQRSWETSWAPISNTAAQRVSKSGSMGIYSSAILTRLTPEKIPLVIC